MLWTINGALLDNYLKSSIRRYHYYKECASLADTSVELYMMTKDRKIMADFMWSGISLAQAH